MAKIYLVAGHGGSDPGACGCGRKEKEDTLKLTLDVGNALAKLGHTIKYNRTSDVTTDMYAYIRECNNFGADICVSIHRNSFNGSAKGYETCIYENSGKTKVLADALNAGMEALGFVNRGSKIRQDLAVLNSTTMSAALLEVGFIDNADDNGIFVNRYTDIVSLIANSILKAVGASGTVSVDNQPSVPQTPAQPSGSTATNKAVHAYYRVRTQKHGWLPEVTDLSDYAGWEESPITDVAIRVSEGSVKYRVHTGGRWLPYVTGCNIHDDQNGYAGIHAPIDAIEVYYYTPDSIRPYKRAKYRVAPVGGSYYPYQFDNETGNGQDGYAGDLKNKIGKFQLCIE